MPADFRFFIFFFLFFLFFLFYRCPWSAQASALFIFRVCRIRPRSFLIDRVVFSRNFLMPADFRFFIFLFFFFSFFFSFLSFFLFFLFFFSIFFSFLSFFLFFLFFFSFFFTADLGRSRLRLFLSSVFGRIRIYEFNGSKLAYKSRASALKFFRMRSSQNRLTDQLFFFSSFIPVSYVRS